MQKSSKDNLGMLLTKLNFYYGTIMRNESYLKFLISSKCIITSNVYSRFSVMMEYNYGNS